MSDEKRPADVTTGATDGEQPPDRPPRILINVADLRRRLGQRRSEPVAVQLARQSVVGSWTTTDAVVGEVTIESIERGVSVFGSARFRWEGDCRRCLELTTGELDVEIAEIFQVDAPADSDLIAFDGDQIDLVPVVRDAVVLSLPLVPLCRLDCAGPDPDRYPALTVDQSEDAKARERAETLDPRWDASVSYTHLTLPTTPYV